MGYSARRVQSPEYVKYGAVVFGAFILWQVYKSTVVDYGKEFALKAMVGLLAFFLLVFILMERSSNDEVECGPQTYEPPYGVTADCWPK